MLKMGENVTEWSKVTLVVTIREDELKYLDRTCFPDDLSELEQDIHEAIYLAWARV